ncbi:MAG: RNA polymerase sigma factor SigF [Pseudanabaenaceae cyanobacterium bins.68]|nr:RNA polymerase sigma factor SigF [Pseudanabaenaceae cyanobacterium bins.68]
MPQSMRDQQVAKLLQAYRVSDQSKAVLRQEIVDLEFHLIHATLREVITEIQGWQSPSYLQLLEIGLRGLTEAIDLFELGRAESFREFANKYIGAQVKGVIRSGESMLKCQSFRLDPHDSKFLQQVVTQLSQPKPQDLEVSGEQIQELKLQTWQLLKLYQASPTIKLRNQIVNLNLGLARREAYHWTNQCTEPFEDLLQVGVMGLIRAIERFSCDRQNAFSSFAVPYIRGEIQHYLRDKASTVRIPRQWLETYQQASKLLPLLRQQLNREPNAQEISNALNISIAEWQEVKLACQNRQPVSLDAKLNHNEDETGSDQLGDLVLDHKYRSFQLAQEDSLRLHQGLEQLEDRTRQIIEFVFLKEFTHREVAEIMGISAVTVSRQVKKGLEILKQVMNTPLDR